MAETLRNRLVVATLLLGWATPAAAVTEYNWNPTLTGNHGWQTNGNWDQAGFPNGSTHVANLSGPLAANLTVSTPATQITLAGITLGGTAGPVSTNLHLHELILRNDDAAFNGGNALVTSGGVPGSTNTINAVEIFVDNERVEFSSASTNNINLGTVATTGPNSSFRSFMPAGLKASVNGTVFMYDQSLALNDSPGGPDIGTPGTLEFNGGFYGWGNLNIGVTNSNHPTPLGTVALRGSSLWAYSGIVTLNRANLILGHDWALGDYLFRAGNPNQSVGFNLLSDNDARKISIYMELRQWQSVKGEHSLEWAGTVFQSNSRGWVNLLPEGKALTLSGMQFAMLASETQRVYAFDGTGRTLVTGGLFDKADNATLNPIFDGSLGHYRKTGTGTLVVSGTNGGHHGDTIIEAGVWRFNTGAHLANTRAIISTGGAIGVDTGTFTNANLLSKIDAADTGGLIVAPSETAAALDFTTGLLANAANMSIAAPETGITFTGTITPANNTYRLGGGTGTLVLPGTNQLTGTNSLVVTNGGEVQLTAVNDFTGTTTITGTAFVSRTNQAIADTPTGISTDMYAPTTLTVTTLGRFGSADSMGVSAEDPSKLVVQGSTLKYVGGDVETDRLFTVGSRGATIDGSGSGRPEFVSTEPIAIQTAGPSAARTLTFTGSTGGGFQPSIGDAADGGTVGLTKTGDGQWVLRGSNTYSGPTNVVAGELIVVGTHTGGSSYNVSPGATLGGIGSIAGNVNVGGTLAPGYDANYVSLDVTGDVTFAAGASLAVTLDGSSIAMLDVVGNFDLSAIGNSLDVSVLGPLSGSSWVVANYTGALTGEFESITAGFTVDYGSGANSQITLLRAPGLPGDFNGDGIVDAADYTVWRNHLGTDDPLNGNGNEEGASAGIVDQADYDTWKANYGTSTGSGSLAGTNVPEPSSLLLLALAAIFPLKLRKRR